MKRSFSRFEAKLDKIKLRRQIEKRALGLHVTLVELYDGQGRTPSIAAARRDIYTWLHEERGKGINEIARLFDRAPSGIQRLIRGAE